jgi:hypothetical protein
MERILVVTPKEFHSSPDRDSPCKKAKHPCVDVRHIPGRTSVGREAGGLVFHAAWSPSLPSPVRSVLRSITPRPHPLAASPFALDASVSPEFFYFSLFYIILRNEFDKNFLKNLTIFTRTSMVSVIYKGVTPVHKT